MFTGTVGKAYVVAAKLFFFVPLTSNKRGVMVTLQIPLNKLENHQKVYFKISISKSGACILVNFTQSDIFRCLLLFK